MLSDNMLCNNMLSDYMMLTADNIILSNNVMLSADNMSSVDNMMLSDNMLLSADKKNFFYQITCDHMIT
jgi:hypothetical protein